MWLRSYEGTMNTQAWRGRCLGYRPSDYTLRAAPFALILREMTRAIETLVLLAVREIEFRTDLQFLVVGNLGICGGQCWPTLRTAELFAG